MNKRFVVISLILFVFLSTTLVWLIGVPATAAPTNHLALEDFGLLKVSNGVTQTVNLPVVMNRFSEEVFYLLWADSGHADADSESFSHWNNDNPPEVPINCAKCHSTYGFLDFLGEDGTVAGEVNNPAPVGTVVECSACHNPTAESMTSLYFNSGMLVSGLGMEAACIQCHQSRNSTLSINNRIGDLDPDDLDGDLGFMNPHYQMAGDTLFGSRAQGAYQYHGQIYLGKYGHVEGYDTCIRCHNSHSLELQTTACINCHEGADSRDRLKHVRETAGDFDGDGDEIEGLALEIETMHETLWAAIQAYADDTIGIEIVYDPVPYPYYFTNTGERYPSWTPRLLRAVYNYHWVSTEPGSYAHNGLYILQILYDSVNDIGGDVSGMIRP
jgi:hypothetical protein